MGTAPASATKPATPPHGRKLGLGGVSLTMARLSRNCGAVMTELATEMESMMEKTGYFERAPFSWVTVMVRFGLKDDIEPKFSRIGAKYGDLPLAIELDVSGLQGESTGVYRAAYRRAVARALLAAGLCPRLAGQVPYRRRPLSSIVERHETN